jgi:uncharacterized membrane protein YdfJ with MMPL/SSD domain
VTCSLAAINGRLALKPAAALAGLFLTGYSLYNGMAVGAIIVVGIAVTGSLTVLPTLLSWLGDRVESGSNWYAFIHVTNAGTAWLSTALGIAFIALGRNVTVPPSPVSAVTSSA